MKTLILTDIFGTKYLQNEIIKLFEDVVVLDAYENKSLVFENEKQAYECFIDFCGHDKYYDLALKICKNQNIDILLGFSAGASVAYRLACSNSLNLKKVISFYPSQIRNHLDLLAKTKTSIIFARKEKSFNTKEVSQKLLESRDVFVEISDYEHGFMNQKSKNYDEKAYEIYLEFIKKEIYETEN